MNFLKIQADIMEKYNAGVEWLDSKYKSSEEKARKIRIKIIGRVVKGRVTVTMEFLDPCDMITQIRYYVDTDPFQNLDFSNPIPNPFTREKAKERRIIVLGH